MRLLLVGVIFLGIGFSAAAQDMPGVAVGKSAPTFQARDQFGKKQTISSLMGGRCFVLAVGLMMPARDLPTELKSASETQSHVGDWLEHGGSAIIGPVTRYIVEPVFDREELIVADLNLNEIDQEFMTFDASGHYSRPDVFTFETKSEQAGVHSSPEATLIGYRVMTDTYLNSEARLRAR